MDKPVMQTNEGAVNGAIFKNEKNSDIWYNIHVSNAYKDKKTGEWKKSNYYKPKDIKKLVKVVQDIQTWLKTTSTDAEGNELK